MRAPHAARSVTDKGDPVFGIHAFGIVLCVCVCLRVLEFFGGVCLCLFEAYFVDREGLAWLHVAFSSPTGRRSEEPPVVAALPKKKMRNKNNRFKNDTRLGLYRLVCHRPPPPPGLALTEVSGRKLGGRRANLSPGPRVGLGGG